MSRAFVSEAAEEIRASQQPERPVSRSPNLVTPNGLAAITTAIAQLQAALSTATTATPDEAARDDGTRARLQRDLRYWQARRASAQLVPVRETAPDEVVFGVAVVVRRDGRRQRYRIVGEDEADPARSLLSYVSPLATALLGAGVGDAVELAGGAGPVTVEAIEA